MNEKSNKNYRVPSETRVGHIHLKVSHLERAIDFYAGLLGFEIMQKIGDHAAFLSAGGYHHHIGLNTWHSLGAGPAPVGSAGMYHVAFLYPTRRDLAAIYTRLVDANYPLTGAADHGVSEALYLDDPDGNGVELYWDRPQAQWPRLSDGTIEMYTHQLDFAALLAELE